MPNDTAAMEGSTKFLFFDVLSKVLERIDGHHAKTSSIIIRDSKPKI